MDKILNIILVQIGTGELTLREVTVAIPDIPQSNFVFVTAPGYFAYVIGVSNAT